ncbi:MAG TPA: hypothetical protein VE775_05465, partial [Pyrinomonadaceae bacterium]|nr:hypothetical protein [Pyrinomonadaceae bacterium]
MTRHPTRQQLARPFMLTIVTLGAAACLYSAYRLPFAQLDPLFLVLGSLTVVLTSRITVRVPGVNGRITISETLIYLTMLLYGGEAAILLAAADGLCSSLLISRRAMTLAYNSALVAFTTAITVVILQACFGPVAAIAHGPFG